MFGKDEIQDNINQLRKDMWYSTDALQKQHKEQKETLDAILSQLTMVKDKVHRDFTRSYTPLQEEAILTLSAQGQSRREVAKAVGVSKNTVCRVLKRHNVSIPSTGQPLAQSRDATNGQGSS